MFGHQDSRLGTSVRVFKDMGERLIPAVDRMALRWLRQLGESDAVRPADVSIVRGVVLSCAAALLSVPALLALALGPAVALPLGVAIVTAIFLCMMAVTIALSARARQESQSLPAENPAFDYCVGLSLLCDAHGEIQRVGGRDRQLLPPTMLEPVGRSLAELVHVSDRIAVVQALDTLRQGAARARAVVRVERGPDSAGGRQFLAAELDLSAVRDDDATLSQVFVQMRDDSAAVQLRDDLAARTAEAQTANEAKSRFLAAVSHELRTPLNAILGFSDVLAGEYFGRLENDRQREYVSLIRQSGAHLLSVVNTMLDMSRIEADRYELITEPFRVADAIESCRAMLDLQARGKGLTLTTRVARNVDELVADRRAVQQILINLAGNAIKFTPAGGVVSIDATIEGRCVLLSVSDTGIGIAPEKMALIGQPFMQAQDDYARSHEGTGLGLSLVKGLVSLHGGTFAIESRKGEGTVVTVTLPLEGPDEASEETAAVETIEFPPRLHKSASVMTTVEQEAAHERAKAKTA
jgi:cell cycle sensor histidine kinase DivJ